MKEMLVFENDKSIDWQHADFQNLKMKKDALEKWHGYGYIRQGPKHKLLRAILSEFENKFKLVPYQNLLELYISLKAEKEGWTISISRGKHRVATSTGESFLMKDFARHCDNNHIEMVPFADFRDCLSKA